MILNTFQVEYTADSLHLPLLRFAKEDRDLMSAVGDVTYECTAAKPAKPVAFTSSDSYMVSIAEHTSRD